MNIFTSINRSAAGAVAALGLATCLMAPWASAGNKTDAASDETVETVRFDYLFKQPVTPANIVVYGPAFSHFTGNKVYTAQGRELAGVGKEILDVAFSPASGYFVCVADLQRKDGRHEAQLMEMSGYNNQVHKFKNKTIGNPSAVAYTPDARKILLATDKGLQELDFRTYMPLSVMPLTFIPERMVVSGNAYFLAAVDGRKVAVYNLEDKKLRKEFEFESEVSSVIFNADNDLMGVMTTDGMMNIYDTRTFLIRQMVEDLGDGLGAGFNGDSKYLVALTAPDRLTVVNLVDEEDPRDEIALTEGCKASKMVLPNNIDGSVLVVFNDENAIRAKRITKLQPYYGKLVRDQAMERLNKWLEMMPGETMEDYRRRVNDETRRAQLRKYEDEIATSLAGDLLSMSNVSLGKYDRGNGILEVDFSNMPSIFLPVPEGDLGSFHSGDDLQFANTRYGVLPNDRFELIYAEITNRNNGMTYTYDNADRVNLKFLSDDDNIVSIELIQQQQMEALRLQELREKVLAEAKSRNVISNHTNITVNSRIEPDYNANGDRILNYIVNFSYEVEPDFTAVEDFPSGKYHAEESGAASSMLALVKEVFETDFRQYVQPGKKLNVKLSGTADATPIRGRINYDGVYGDFVDEPIYQGGQMKTVTVTKAGGITENEQLAFLRAAGVKNFLQNQVEGLDKLNTDYRYDIGVAEGKGSEFRRITAEFTFFDVFK